MSARTWAGVLMLLAAALALVVAMGLTTAADHALLTAVQALGNPPLDYAYFGFSLLGSIEVTGLGILLICYLNRDRPLWSWARWWPLLVFVALVLIELLMKEKLPQPAPPRSLSRGPHFGAGVDTPFSYPSGHMLRTVMVYGLAVLTFPRLRRLWPWTLAAGLVVMAVGRVYLGDHWPADVLGGALLGAAGIAICLGWRH